MFDQKGRGAMNKLLGVGLVVCVSCFAQSVTVAQEATAIQKREFQLQ
jgi:hypothetical protein